MRSIEEHSRLENAIAEALGASKPPPLGVVLRRDGDHDKELVVEVTLRRGERYCCLEAVCVLGGVPDQAWWSRLREAMVRNGIRDLWPVSVELRIKVEEGAMYGWPKPWPHDDEVTYVPSAGYEYTYGLFQEGVEEEIE